MRGLLSVSKDIKSGPNTYKNMIFFYLKLFQLKNTAIYSNIKVLADQDMNHFLSLNKIKKGNQLMLLLHPNRLHRLPAQNVRK